MTADLLFQSYIFIYKHTNQTSLQKPFRSTIPSPHFHFNSLPRFDPPLNISSLTTTAEEKSLRKRAGESNSGAGKTKLRRQAAGKNE